MTTSSHEKYPWAAAVGMGWSHHWWQSYAQLAPIVSTDLLYLVAITRSQYLHSIYTVSTQYLHNIYTIKAAALQPDVIHTVVSGWVLRAESSS